MAGVSKATVSRVINNKPDVSADTKEMIMDIIKKNDYYPSALAQGASIKKSNTVGIILPENNTFDNPFFIEMLGGINEAAAQNGYYCLLNNISHTKEKVLGIYKQKRIDGLILMSPRKDLDIIELLIEEEIPFISTSKISGFDSLNYVDIDNYLGAKLATEHLIALGHKNIGILTGPYYMESSIDRKKIFYRTLLKHGIKPREECIIEGLYSYESGFLSMERLLSVKNPPTAVFIASDVMAFGAIQYLDKENIKVPKEISIVGFDDLSYSSLIKNPLTTVRQPAFRKGFRTAKALIDIIEGRMTKTVKEKLPVELIIRQSTAAPNNK